MLRKDTPKYNWGKIVDEGMGGFLNPPNHPEHNYSVVSTYGDTFSMSLSSAISKDSEWLNDETKREARALLKKWEKEKLTLDNPLIQDWICQVMGYFRDCYCSITGSWKATDLQIVPPPYSAKDYSCSEEKLNLMNAQWVVENQNNHAGVHMIKQFYPNFVLKRSHVLNAYWGKK